MKAYRIHSLNNIGLDELEAQPVGENCVKLKNLICGVSTSDISMYSGRLTANYPIIPVRQCVGFVSEVGSGVTGLARGNRAVVYPQASCHSCASCKDGHYYDCEKPSVFGIAEDGFLSDFSVVAASDIYAIPERLKDEEAIYTEHTALAINVLSRLKIEKGEHIVIMGATSIGIILAQVAMYYQAVPIVVDVREDMLQAARDAGVYYTVDAVNEDVNKKVLTFTGGHMAECSAYMLSTTLPLQNLFACTAKYGKVALVGRPSTNEIKVNLMGLIDKKLDIVTITDCGKSYPSAINMLANHIVSVDMLPTRVVSFADVPAAFKECAESGDDSIKMLIKI